MTPAPPQPERSPLDAAVAAVAAVKPRLRGWIHAGSFPLVLAAGVVLVLLAPAGRPRLGSVIFAITAAMLFGTSAVYHRGTWSDPIRGLLKRMDHSNIFLIIAGTYTPFALLLLPPDQMRSLLLVAWIGAVGGVLFRVFWVGAPRWLYTPIYVALGWVSVFYIKPLYDGAEQRDASGAVIVILIAVGGLLYTLGAFVYGLKRPNPSPRWFGFHEIFHVLTVAAFVVHYIAVSMAVYTSPA